MRKPGLEQGGTGPRTSARRQWSQGTGWTPNSILNSFLFQEGTAHLVPSLGQGWGWVSGLGCVGSRTQKAQCLPRPLQPGPALFQEPGGCPAPGWAKGAICDIHAHRGPAPVPDPPAPPPHALTRKESFAHFLGSWCQLSAGTHSGPKRFSLPCSEEGLMSN